jgi:hypothetical protein
MFFCTAVFCPCLDILPLERQLPRGEKRSRGRRLGPKIQLVRVISADLFPGVVSVSKVSVMTSEDGKRARICLCTARASKLNTKSMMAFLLPLLPV